MSISYLVGNLFDSQAQALAHGVNCRGVMGKGIAKEFRSRYPEMYRVYRLECLFERLKPGGVWVWYGEDKIIFNLATQDRTGPDATYKNVSDCLGKMKSLANQLDVRSISMPRISCGIGGLKWELVKKIVEEVFGDWDRELSVYERAETKLAAGCKPAAQ